MRTFIVAAATIGLLVTAAQAADDASPIAGKFSDVGTLHTILFTLKKNGISLRIEPNDFCTALGYDGAVKKGETGFWEQGHRELKDDGTENKPRELNWVLCGYSDAHR